MSKCGICADKRRPEIDVALNGGWPLRMIAEHFPGISKDVAGRHKKHMGVAVPMKELPPPESDSSQMSGPSECAEPLRAMPLTVTRPEHDRRYRRKRPAIDRGRAHSPAPRGLCSPRQMIWGKAVRLLRHCVKSEVS